MQMTHKTYGTCLVADDDWHSDYPMIMASFRIPVRTPRGELKTLTVGKGALKGPVPSRGYVRRHKSKSLAERYLPLARSIAWSMKTEYDQWDDFEIIAVIGLCEAADRYDDGVGSFEALARTYIRGKILNHWRAEAKTNEEFNADETFWTSIQLIDETKEERELLAEVRHHVKGMSRRKRKIIEARYLTDEPLTWKELSHEFNLTHQALDKLRVQAIAELTDKLS